MVIEHTVVGKKLPMVDAKEKVSGNGEYIADMTLPGICAQASIRTGETVQISDPRAW